MCSTPGPGPIGASQGDDASLVVRQRERSCMPVWHLLFVGCFTRARTDTSACNSSTCSPVETRHPQVVRNTPGVVSDPLLLHAHYIIHSGKWQILLSRLAIPAAAGRPGHICAFAPRRL